MLAVLLAAAASCVVFPAPEYFPPTPSRVETAAGHADAVGSRLRNLLEGVGVPIVRAEEDPGTHAQTLVTSYKPLATRGSRRERRRIAYKIVIQSRYDEPGHHCILIRVFRLIEVRGYYDRDWYPDPYTFDPGGIPNPLGLVDDLVQKVVSEQGEC